MHITDIIRRLTHHGFNVKAGWGTDGQRSIDISSTMTGEKALALLKLLDAAAHKEKLP